MTINESQLDDTGATQTTSPETKIGGAFSCLNRTLTDKELAAPGVQKLLLEERERLQEENSVLRAYQEKFHASDKEVAVLSGKLTSSNAWEILSGGCLVIGAAALGYVPAVWSAQPTGWIMLVGGALLIVSGFIAKAVRL
ncbi:MAG: hypothetical protein WBQ49_13895 [Rhodomicrobium sp.]